MGMSFSREEFEAVTPEMMEEILINLKYRCHSMSLECSREKSFNKIAKSLKGYANKKWEDVRDGLGFLIIDEPALIHAYIKTIKA